MKVKIFGYFKYSDLENNINNFIADKKVIDIKFSSEYNNNVRGIAYFVLIMYEEGDTE